MAIATVLRERRPDGLLDVCPANASYQGAITPDRLKPATWRRCASTAAVGGVHRPRRRDAVRRPPARRRARLPGGGGRDRRPGSIQVPCGVEPLVPHRDAV